MIQNYFKMAFRVLGRNKLYTFICLFGISFTLMGLMIGASYFENAIGANAPLSDRDKIRVISQGKMIGWNREEVVKIDSNLVNGIMVYDTTRTEEILEGNAMNSSSSNLGYDFCKEYLFDFETPEYTSIFAINKQMDLFINGKKKPILYGSVDTEYWKVFDFEFLEGVPFTKADIEGQLRHVILQEHLAKTIFGKQSSYLNKTFSYKGQQYTITGVIADINTSIMFVNQSMFLPYTLLKDSELNSFAGFGSMAMAYKVPSESLMPKLEQELRGAEKRVDMTRYERFDAFKAKDQSVLEFFAESALRKEENNYARLRWIVGIAVILFLLIPTINLININTTRIMERSAEIGVRKSFGATASDLVIQFLFENTILTLIGGVIGYFLSLFMIQWINDTHFFGRLVLEMNPKLLFISVLITLVFGVLSGIIPAWRTSKMNIAKALKTNAI